MEPHAREAPWKRWGVPLALTTVAFIYGCWSVIAKAVLVQNGERQVNPLILASYRSFGGGTVMYIFHRCITMAYGQQAVKNPAGHDKPLALEDTTRWDVFRFAVLGVLMAANIGGNILALEFLPALTVSVFQPAMPVTAGVLSVLFGEDKLSGQKACGLLCAAGGAVVVITFGAHGGHTAAGGGSFHTGFPFLLANVVGGALYMVVQKGVLRTHPPVLTAAIGFGLAGVILTIASLLTAGVDAHAWRLGGSMKAVLALLYAIFLTTAVNYSILAWANKESTPATATSFLTLQPVAAAVLSWVAYRIVLTAGQALGGVAIIVGLLIFSWKPSQSTGASASDALKAFAPTSTASDPLKGA